MRHTTSCWLRYQRDHKLLREEPAGNTAGCAPMLAITSQNYFTFMLLPSDALLASQPPPLPLLLPNNLPDSLCA